MTRIPPSLGALTESVRYQVFFGTESFAADGNPNGNFCDLTFSDLAGYHQSKPTDITLCHGEITNQSLELHCLQAGREIACCGHGLLAAAHRYMELHSVAAVNLLMHGSRVKAYRDSNEYDKVWLDFAPIALQKQAPPDWLYAVFPQQAKWCLSAQASADKTGYWVFEWPQELLKSLPVPNPTLANYTQRALVNTCHIAQDKVGLRYFAPQYGNPEDRATGSAMRVVASYWRKNELIAYQMSKAGGLLFARFSRADQRVSVGGYCRLIAR